MLAEEFILFLESLIRSQPRCYPDGSPRVVSASPFVPTRAQVCDLDHIYSAWRLLSLCRWGLKGSVSAAAGTRNFEPDGVAFCALGRRPSSPIGRPPAVPFLPRSAHRIGLVRVVLSGAGDEGRLLVDHRDGD